MKTLLLLLFLSSLLSCDSKHTKLLLVPEKLEHFCDNDLNTLTLSKQFSILHYFNADCSSCMLDLEILSNNILKFQNFDSIKVIIIGYSENPAIPCYYFQQMDLPFDVFKDKNRSFLTRNNLFGNNYTFIIDSKNLIQYKSEQFNVDELLDRLLELI